MIVRDDEDGYQDYLDSLIPIPDMPVEEDDRIPVFSEWSEEAIDQELSRLESLLESLGLGWAEDNQNGWCAYATKDEIEGLDDWVIGEKAINPEYPFKLADGDSDIYLQSYGHAVRELTEYVQDRADCQEEMEADLARQEQQEKWIEEEEEMI